MAHGNCSIPDCVQIGKVIRGWCTRHYQTWRRLGDPLASVQQKRSACLVADCTELAIAKHLCAKHYQRNREHGSTDPQPGKPRQTVEERRAARARQRIRERERIAASNCKVNGCPQTANKAAGMCAGHHYHWKRYGDPLASAPPRKRKPPVACSIDGCASPAKCRTWCSKHYQCWRTHGDPSGRTPPEPVVCAVDQCPLVVVARGLCGNHYAIWRRSGDPTKVAFTVAPAVLATRDLPPVARFWARVDKSGLVPAGRPELGPCWVWMGGINKEGYGTSQIFKESGTTTLAHRIAWELSGGRLVPGLQLDHLCENRSCVRPSHIEQVPAKVNILRSGGVSAVNARKTRCSRGHEFTPGNVRQSPSGRRQCRACDAVNYRQRAGSVSLADRKIANDYRWLLLKELCRYCGRPSRHADHFYPSSKRPGDNWWRLVPACLLCNVRKSDRCGTWFLLKTQALTGVE